MASCSMRSKATPVAARRPGALPRKGEVRRNQHGGAGHDRQAALQQPGECDPLAQQGFRDPAHADQPEQHRERRAMGRRGEGGKDEQRRCFESGNLLAMQHQDEQRQHREPCENVGSRTCSQATAAPWSGSTIGRSSAAERAGPCSAPATSVAGPRASPAPKGRD